MSDDYQRLVAALEEAELTKGEQANLVDQLTKQLESASRSQRDFSRVVSHELKAPLRRILGFAQVVREECRGHDEDGSVEEALSFIEEGVLQMEQVIDTLRKFAKLDYQGIDASLVDLDDVLDEALNYLNIRNVVVRETDLPEVMGDEHLLRQLFANLISNGLKFNTDECPCVCIRALELPDQWRIEVSDNGIGIEEHYLPRMFGIFERFHPGKEGEGVGLALCRKIVEAHQGEIGVNTTYGEGSTFWFDLPKVTPGT